MNNSKKKNPTGDKRSKTSFGALTLSPVGSLVSAIASRSGFSSPKTPLAELSGPPSKLQHHFYGRSPYSQKLANYFSHYTSDTAEVISNFNPGQEAGDKLRGNYIDDVPNHNKLKQELQGYWHTAYALTSAPHAYTAEALARGEATLLSANDTNVHGLGRVNSTLTLEEDNITIEASVSMLSYTYHVASYIETYPDLINPEFQQTQWAMQLLTGPNQGRKPLITAKFFYRYVADIQSLNDAYDLRRRVFSHTLAVPNIDEMDDFSHVDLAEAMITRLRAQEKTQDEGQFQKSGNESDNPDEAFSLQSHGTLHSITFESENEPLSVQSKLRRVGINKPESIPHFSEFPQDAKKFQLFHNMSAWNQHLAQTTPKGSSTNRFIFPLTEELMPQESQGSIQKDVFNNLTTLYNIQKSLHPGMETYKAEEKKAELYELLMGYLSGDLFSTLENRAEYLSTISGMQDRSIAFNEKEIKLIVNALMIHFPRDGKLIFDVNTIELSHEYLQHAFATQREILASIFNELSFLHYIAAQLDDSHAMMLKNPANRIGLCISLLKYLECPFEFSPKEENTEHLNRVKEALNISFLFEQSLKPVVQYLIKQFQQQYAVTQANYKHLQQHSSEMVWENVKKLISEMGVVTQLKTIGQNTANNVLVDFAGQCDNYLQPFSPRSGFINLLQSFLQKEFFSLSGDIIKLLLKIAQDCGNPYRDFTNIKNNLTEKDKPHPFLIYSLKHIVNPLEIIKLYTEQLEELNAYYVLKTCCSAVLKNKVEAVKAIEERIEGLQGPVKSKTRISLKILEERRVELKDKLKEILLADDRRRLFILANETLKTSYSSVISWFCTELFSDITESMDDAYCLFSTTKYLYSFFDKSNDARLEKIRKTTSAGARSEEYIHALILRHFYVALSGYYLRDNPNEEIAHRDFFYSRFSYDKEGWLRAFYDNVNEPLAETLSEIQPFIATIGPRISDIFQGGRTIDSYIEGIEKSLQFKAFDKLDIKGQAIIKACAWMAVLVNRHGVRGIASDGTFYYQHVFSQNDIKAIYDKIFPALEQLDIPKIVEEWNAYIKLEAIGKKAETEWNEMVVSRNSASTVSSSPSPQASAPEGTVSELMSLNTVGNFLYSQTLLEPKSSLSLNVKLLEFDIPLSLGVTLWKHVAERLFNAIKISIIRDQRLSAKVSARDSIEYGNQIMGMQATMAETLVVLASFCLNPVSANRPLALEVLKCLKDLVDSNDRIAKTLLEKVELLLKNPDPSNGPIVRAIFFSEPERDVFLENNFYSVIERKLLQSPDAGEALSLENIFLALQGGLTRVFGQVEKPECHPFIPDLMEPLLTAFILIYNHLFTAKNDISHNILSSWQESVKQIGNLEGQVPGGHLYAEFAQTWCQIMARVFFNDHTDSDINPKNLKQDPHDLVLAYVAYAKLNIIPAMKIIEDKWLSLTSYQLNLSIAEALCVVLGPISNLVRGEEKLSRLATLFTRNVTGVLRLGRVLCVLVSDNYYHEASRYFSWGGTLDRDADDLRKIYEARVALWQNDRTLPTPFNYPVVFVYRHGKDQIIKSIEIHEEKGKIVRNDGLANDSHLFNRAAALLLNDQTRLLRDQTAVLENLLRENSVISAHLDMRIFPEFFTIVLELLHESMLSMKRSSAGQCIPLSYALTKNSAVQDDPLVLSLGSEKEIKGLFILGLIYVVLEQKKTEANVAAWLLNLPRFFEHQKNLQKLGASGVIASGILNCVSSDPKDPVKVALQKLDTKFPPKQSQQEYCRLFKEYRSVSRQAMPDLVEPDSSQASSGHGSNNSWSLNSLIPY